MMLLRMATLSGQLEAVEQRLTDLGRQRERLEADRGDADRMTTDAADALARLAHDLAEGEARFAEDEQRRPSLARVLEQAEAASRSAELAQAQAMAEQAGAEAEWRVAEAELAQAQARLDRLENDAMRHAARLAELAQEGDPEVIVAAALARSDAATRLLAQAREALVAKQERKAELQAARDGMATALSAARGDYAGIEREHAALLRDREARAKQAKAGHGLPVVLDTIRAEPGYERALAAVLGRDAKAAVGAVPNGEDGRFWTGATSSRAVAQSLAAHVITCPPQLAARLALVHVAGTDDGRALAPGEWLVTLGGQLRRWDGFIARGEGSAEAARLEAENRFAQLDAELPGKRALVAEAETAQAAVEAELSDLQSAVVVCDRAIAEAAEGERAALRALDQAEDARTRLANRRTELAIWPISAGMPNQTAPPPQIASLRCRIARLGARRWRRRNRGTMPRDKPFRRPQQAYLRTTKRWQWRANAPMRSAPTFAAGRPALAMPRGGWLKWVAASTRSKQSAPWPRPSQPR
jgi:chromosome segregation protein